MKPSSSKPTITPNRRSKAVIAEDNAKMLKDQNLPPNTPITTAMIRKSKAMSNALAPTTSTSKAPSKPRQLPLPAPSVPTQPRVTYSALMAKNKGDEESQKKEKEEAENNSRNPCFDNIDLGFLINHLSQPANHAKLLASGPKTTVGGLSCGAEWNILAALINNMHNNRLGLTNTSSPNKLNLNGVQTKKAQQAALSLAKRPAKPLPALNATDAKRKKPIENSLEQFYDEQIKASTSKQDERGQVAAKSAADTLDFKQKKWDLQIEREDKRIASESTRLLQIAQLNNENDKKKARREAIEHCRKENMPMEEMKDYIAFLFPTSDKA
ncbi:uncharacterized protein MELLADRAFT_106603 [Melampsora larici-populina 98AG31]|uniref:Uncharacterized protein n=1 Tax=Melampsora larici-populina (strain 98AG31 / pathotype 3-4-7) TaxID=747676 RepID=F4RM17_MELLP|nr:uncharacterized protein MELLADRAFT_106603 [Melampsora larici-populina 98AG31]EGG06645.1 hypothetical protein MELLADRAFT_106603 [Melampsora larici-populina 98AG31]